MSRLSVGNPNSVREKNDHPSLSLRERILLHQVHPVKLATDWGTGLAAAWLLWDHNLAAALIVGFVPSICISIYLILRADLTRFRDSPLGRYFLSPLTRPGDQVRLFGLIVAWTGAWFNSMFFALAGLAIILYAWGKGLLVSRRGEDVPGRRS